MILVVAAMSEIDLPVNITLLANTAFYITDITVPVSWYTIEAGRNNTVYYILHTDNTLIAKCELPEGNYTTASLAQSLVDVMNVHYPSVPVALSAGGSADKFIATSSFVSNTISIINGKDQFEPPTDEQALALAYEGIGGITYPLNSVNTMLHNTVPKVSILMTTTSLTTLTCSQTATCISSLIRIR